MARARIIATLGLLQILAWGSSFYLLGVLGKPIAEDTGWPLTGVVGGLSVALLAAGVASPVVGRMIHRRGGRSVLATSSVLLASGLALMALAPVLPVYLLAWLLVGVGMGAGLYDPAFATLGHLYGQNARPMITAVTLFGGFASTLAWPLSAYALEQFGWRGVCALYAGLHLMVGLPAYLMLVPREATAAGHAVSATASIIAPLPIARQSGAFWLLGIVLTVGAATLSLVSTHLLTLLVAGGLELSAAVALGALIGPSQVTARVIDLAFGRRQHPIWTMLVGTCLVAVGTILLWSGWALPGVALVAYGAGNGISSIVRGTMPLVLFGPDRYALLMGKLGLPILMAMALAPAAGSVLVESGGPALTYGVVAAASLLNVVLTLVLQIWIRRSVRPTAPLQ